MQRLTVPRGSNRRADFARMIGHASEYPESSAVNLEHRIDATASGRITRAPPAARFYRAHANPVGIRPEPDSNLQRETSPSALLLRRSLGH